MINIKGLHKSFGKNKVLKGIDLTIEKGGIFAVLGPNSSGKTTLIKSILGMVLPDKGEITFLQNNIRKNASYRNKINYLPQIANFPSNLKVMELVNMIKDLRGTSDGDQELIELFKLSPFLNIKLGQLSGGTKQKVNLLLTFMFNSPLLILDEPTSGLDPVSLIALKKLISKEAGDGKTFLITSHIMSFVEEVADEIVFILEGKIVFKGSVELLKSNTKNHNLESAIASILITSDV